MGKSVIIVESAAKTKTISGFLGGDYRCEASMGHVRDLPERELGVDVDESFRPTYKTLRGKGDVLTKLRSAVKGADRVYLATDPDREGEAIAWHLREALGLKDAQRIEFNEITRTAVEEALRRPRDIDMDRVNAQQARRVLDRLVGYKLSPLLLRKVKPARSAGRVQSVAVRLIVEREREIRAFTAEEYWRLVAEVTPAGRPTEAFEARLETIEGQKVELGDIPDAATAAALVAELEAADLVVSSVGKRNSSRNPFPPYITSTLQRDASTRLGFRAKRTMSVAQRLYEGLELKGEQVGLITYMRTDSTRVAKEAQDEARGYIADTWGEKFVGGGSRGRAPRGAQDAHEAIRPTSVHRHPDEIDALLPGNDHRDERRLYRLVWTRFVASQMAAARFETTLAEITAGRLGLRASGTEVKFPGYLELTGLPQPKKSDGNGEGDDDDSGDDDLGRLLPPLREGEGIDLRQVNSSQHFTQPPPRYTEASLVKALEERGIGRPSTYAPIVATIVDRGYTRLVKNRFEPTQLGEVVTDLLIQHFPSIMDVDFTATLESDLDDVEQGRSDWVELLQGFYTPFQKAIDDAYEGMGRVRIESDQACPKCGSSMVLRDSRYGQFLGCSQYPECDGIVNLDREGNPVDTSAEATEHHCPKCNQPMQKVKGRWGDYLRCSRHPECDGRLRLDRQGNPLPPSETVETDVKCEKCGKPMVLRRGRRGPFLGCSGYPKCKSIVDVDETLRARLAEQGIEVPAGPARSGFQPVTTPLKCEQCGSELVLRMGRFGPFLGCSGYPKCRTLVKIDEQVKAQLAAHGIELPERGGTSSE